MVMERQSEKVILNKIIGKIDVLIEYSNGFCLSKLDLQFYWVSRDVEGIKTVGAASDVRKGNNVP